MTTFTRLFHIRNEIIYAIIVYTCAIVHTRGGKQMKIKHAIMTFVIALTVGVSVGAGLNVKKVVKEVKAYEDVEYRFTNNYSWGGTLYAYAWTGEGQNKVENATWPGQAMTFYYQNEEATARSVFKVSVSSQFTKIIFNDGGTNQTENITIGTKHGFYISGDGGGQTSRSAGTYDLTSTYYLYDYNGSLNGSAYCYAWNERTNDIGNNGWPGVEMHAMDAAKNNRVFSIELDVKYTSVIFNDGNGHQTIDLKPSTSNAPANTKAFYMTGEKTGDNFTGTWWENINYVIAQNWHDNLLDFRTTDATAGAGRDSNGCESLYGNAKLSYQNMNQYMKQEVNESFYEALTRMEKWAEHHHEVFTLNEQGIGSFSSNSTTLISSINKNNNDYSTIIIVVSVLSISALGLFLFLKKRKESK